MSSPLQTQTNEGHPSSRFDTSQDLKTDGPPIYQKKNNQHASHLDHDQYMQTKNITITENYLLNEDNGIIDTKRQLVHKEESNSFKQQRLLRKQTGKVRSYKKQEKKKSSIFQWFQCFNKSQASTKSVINFDDLASQMSNPFAQQALARKRWAFVRKKLTKIVVMGKIKDMYVKTKKDIEEETEIKRSYVMMPDNKYKFQFDVLVTLSYIASFFLIPFVIAFDIKPLEYIQWIEFAFDIVLALSILLKFFTAIYEDNKVVLVQKDIALKYIFAGTFVFDAFSCLPGLVTGESVKWVYYFKIIRYSRMNLLFSEVQKVINKIMKAVDGSTTINNFFVILQTLLHMLGFFHILSCFWIMLGYSENGWITIISSEEDKESMLYIYVTSIYFVFATASTVGYGDNYARNQWEKLYMIFLQFAGICFFSIISGKIAGLQRDKKILEIVDEKVNSSLYNYDLQQNEIENYLLAIDQSCEQDFSGELYDSAKEYIKICYINGIEAQVKDGGYFRLLPPRLKNQLTFQVLDKYYEKFFYFFNDVQSKNFANETFVRKILVNLDCQVFLPQKNIVNAGEMVNRFCFIWKGGVFVKPGKKDQSNDENHSNYGSSPVKHKTTLFQRLTQQKHEIDYISLLPEGSFFGDYQILFNIPSNYDYQTLASECETQCMTLSDKKLLSICEEYPEFHGFLCQRALMRRNYFKAMEKRLETKMMNIINNHADQNEGDTLDEIDDADFNEELSKYKTTREKNKLMAKELVNLEQIERSQFKADQEKVFVNFTIPITRLYLQSVGDISQQISEQMTTKLHKSNEFFKFIAGMQNGEDLNKIQQDFAIVFEATKPQKVKSKPKKSEINRDTKVRKLDSTEHLDLEDGAADTETGLIHKDNWSPDQKQIQNGKKGHKLPKISSQEDYHQKNLEMKKKKDSNNQVKDSQQPNENKETSKKGKKVADDSLNEFQ